MARDPGFYVQQVVRAQRFLLDLDRPDRAGLVVACGGMERCARGYAVRRHGFPWCGIELVLDGAGTLELGDARHVLGEGSLFTYGPGIPHAIASDVQRPLLKAFVDLGGREARKLLGDVGLAPGTVRQVALTALDRDLLGLLIATGRAGGESAPAVCASLATALVQSLGLRAVSADRGREPAWHTWRRCRTWIDGQAEPPMDLEEIATGCGLSAAYLCRLFRRYDRTTPMALVRRRRLQEAAQALVVPGARLDDIATAAGYSDQFHFSRAFQREFGQPPSHAARREQRSG